MAACFLERIKYVCIYQRNAGGSRTGADHSGSWRHRLPDSYAGEYYGCAAVHWQRSKNLHLSQLLLKVNGIGPKGALGVLSALTAEQLRFAVLSGDAKAIAKAPGIGAKTAQRIILELKDKLNLEDAFCSSKDDAADAGTDGNVRNEAAQALAALGYSASEALAAVSGLEISEGAGVEDVLKAALKQML